MPAAVLSDYVDRASDLATIENKNSRRHSSVTRIETKLHLLESRIDSRGAGLKCAAPEGALSRDRPSLRAGMGRGSLRRLGVSPFTVGRSPARCKAAGFAGAERSEGSLAPCATVTGR
jgi:hypothetical protein